MVLLLAMTADVAVAQGYSELVPCGSGVYLLVRDDGYVVVYAVSWLDEDWAIQVALDCMQAIELSPLAHRAPPTLQPTSGLIQDLKQLEKIIEQAISASRQAAAQDIYTVQKIGERETTTACAAMTHYTVRHSISPTVSLLFVVLCALLGYFLSKLVLGRALSSQ